MHSSSLRKFWSLAAVMAAADFRLRYAGSALGYFWSLSKPLALFGVLYVVFAHFLRFGEGIPDYPVMLLLGIVMWTFFVECTSASVTILVARADMIRKLSFPRIVLPVSISMTAGMTLLLNLAAVFVFVIGSGIEPRWSWLLFPLLIAELYVLAVGVSLLLSAAFVRLRDVGQLWDLGVQLLFYATPIIYPLEVVPAQYREWLMINPLAQVIQDARAVLVSPDLLGTNVLPASLIWIPFVSVAMFLVGGLLYYRATSPRIAEWV